MVANLYQVCGLSGSTLAWGSPLSPHGLQRREAYLADEERDQESKVSEQPQFPSVLRSRAGAGQAAASVPLSFKKLRIQASAPGFPLNI